MNFRLKMLIVTFYGNQANFAMECGRSESWVSRILSGRRKPTSEDKEILSRFLKIKDIESYFSDYSGKTIEKI